MLSQLDGVCFAAAAGMTSAVCFGIASGEFPIFNTLDSDAKVAAKWTRVACVWAMISFVGFGIVSVLKKN